MVATSLFPVTGLADQIVATMQVLLKLPYNLCYILYHSCAGHIVKESLIEYVL